MLCEDNERLRRTKYIITNRLSPADRKIIHLYAEYGSIRKLAAELDVSRGTAHKEVKRIREIVRRNYELLCRNGDADAVRRVRD